MSGWRTDQSRLESSAYPVAHPGEASMMAHLRSLSDVDAALAFWVLLTAGALAGEPYRQVEAKEITHRFVGQEFTDEVHWAYVFGTGGRLSSVSMGKAGNGIWRVEDDRLCLLPEAFPERCYEVWMAGNRVQLREPGIEVYEEGLLQMPRKRQ